MSGVFVGNMPFGMSEEQIKELFETVGRVINFRLITDKETGKSKGYGFVDFADADAAASAIRNLHNHEIQGRRIRVALPTGKDDPTNQGGHPFQDDPTSATQQQSAPPLPSNMLPPMPPGIDLPPNLKASDVISQTLSQLPPPQLLDALTQMKAMAISEPQRATELLRATPQLSYALFQALILMNLVDPKILAQVVEQAASAPRGVGSVPTPVPQQPQQQQPPPQHQQYQQPYQPPPVPQPQQQPRPQAYPPPQPPLQQQPPQSQHEQLLQQVLAMDQRTIDTLPPNERSQIMALRAQMGVR